MWLQPCLSLRLVRLHFHGDGCLVLCPKNGFLVSCFYILVITGVFLEQRMSDRD